MMDPLQRVRSFSPEFFEQDPREVARQLLGAWLWTRTDAGACGGVIVDTEAYLAQADPACHAAAGVNRKNRSMFGPAGRAYVYVIHARCCFNVVTEPEGIGSAVLIRAIEPRLGLEEMQRRRPNAVVKQYTNGPAKLCEALAIDRTYDGLELSGDKKIAIGFDPAADPLTDERIATTTRIGVTSGHELPYRYVLADSPYLSRRLPES